VRNVSHSIEKYREKKNNGRKRDICAELTLTGPKRGAEV